MNLFRFFLLFMVILSSGLCHAKARLKCPPVKSTYQYDQIILDAARKVNIDAALIHAVIKQESCYDRFAVSHAGAEGLMQLMPATARRFNVSNSFIASQNINAGAKYLSWLLKRFKGNVRYALAGYNAGEGKVDRYNGIPPYKETRKYVKRVMNFYRGFKGIPSAKKRTLIAKATPHKKRKNKRIKTPVISLKTSEKRPTKLALNKARKNKESVLVKHNKRTRISSVTLTKKFNGYTRVNAKSLRGKSSDAS